MIFRERKTMKKIPEELWEVFGFPLIDQIESHQPKMRLIDSVFRNLFYTMYSFYARKMGYNGWLLEEDFLTWMLAEEAYIWFTTSPINLLCFVRSASHTWCFMCSTGSSGTLSCNENISPTTASFSACLLPFFQIFSSSLKCDQLWFFR